MICRAGPRFGARALWPPALRFSDSRHQARLILDSHRLLLGSVSFHGPASRFFGSCHQVRHTLILCANSRARTKITGRTSHKASHTLILRARARRTLTRTPFGLARGMSFKHFCRLEINATPRTLKRTPTRARAGGAISGTGARTLRCDPREVRARVMKDTELAKEARFGKLFAALPPARGARAHPLMRRLLAGPDRRARAPVLPFWTGSDVHRFTPSLEFTPATE